MILVFSGCCMGEFFLIRHSKGNYKEYDKILQSDNPQSPFDHTKQDQEDLTEAGKELARKKAEKFFNELNAGESQLFFVTSNEARAIETANIYREVAKALGFEIIKPEHSRSKYAEKIGEGELRTIDTLSLNTDNMLQFLVFSATAPEVNWGAVDDKTRVRWQQAREIIEADNRGSWGANFRAHSEGIKNIFPDVETSKEFYDTKFGHIIRLLKWADKKIVASERPKQIKVLAFGHEDYLVDFLANQFSEEGIDNCEAVHFTVDSNTIVANYRNKAAALEASQPSPNHHETE